MLAVICASLLSGQVPCSASPIGSNPFEKYMIFMPWNFLLFCLAENLNKWNEDEHCSVDTNLSVYELEQIALKKPIDLYVKKGANASLLANTDSFKHVSDFWLEDENNITAHLKNLVSYHPKAVRIRQSKRLSGEALTALSAINITDLFVDCGIASSELFASNPPKNLKKFEVCGTVGALNLPSLKSLCLYGMRVNAKTLQNIHTPKLNELILCEVKLEDGCVDELKRFKNLRKLFLSRMSISSGDFAKLKKRMFFKLECNQVRIVSPED